MKLKWSLSTGSFSIFPLFSIAMRTLAYCISILIGQKVEYKFLIEEFVIKKVFSLSLCVVLLQRMRKGEK